MLDARPGLRANRSGRCGGGVREDIDVPRPEPLKRQCWFYMNQATISRETGHKRISTDNIPSMLGLRHCRWPNNEPALRLSALPWQLGPFSVWISREWALRCFYVSISPKFSRVHVLFISLTWLRKREHFEDCTFVSEAYLLENPLKFQVEFLSQDHYRFTSPCYSECNTKSHQKLASVYIRFWSPQCNFKTIYNDHRHII